MDLLKAFQLLIGGGDTYISQRPENLGTRYKKYGPISIIDGPATHESKQQAIYERNQPKRDAQAARQAARLRPRLPMGQPFGPRPGAGWNGIQLSTGLDGTLNGSNFIPQPTQQIFQAPRGTGQTLQSRRLEDYYN